MKNFLLPKYYARFESAIAALNSEEIEVLKNELPKVLEAARQRNNIGLLAFLCSAAFVNNFRGSVVFLNSIFEDETLYHASRAQSNRRNIEARAEFIRLALKKLNNIKN